MDNSQTPPPDGTKNAANQAPDSETAPENWMGPHANLQKCRPYYLLSLDAEDLEKPDRARSFQGNIEQIVQEVKALNRPITDVFIVSHGWHRNRFGGVSAYDRLVSRFLFLRRSNRLQSPASFSPLFLCLHWHSDPGDDSWTDKNGRRSKLSFMENVREHFHAIPQPNQPLEECEAMYLRDFEQFFEILSNVVSTPETKSVHIGSARMKAAHARLDSYRLVGAPEGNATRADKTAVLWQCYHEATPRGRLTSQTDTTPHGYLSFAQAAKLLFSFALALGALTVLSPLLGRLLTFVKSLLTPLVTLLARVVDFLTPVVDLRSIAKSIGDFVSLQILAKVEPPLQALLDLIPEWLRPLLVFFVLLLATSSYLRAASTWPERKNRKRSRKKARGVSIILLLCYAFTQVVFLIPLVITDVLTYLFGGTFSVKLWRKSLRATGDERIGKRDTPATIKDIANFRSSHNNPFSRGGFAALARKATNWFQNAVPPDSAQASFADLLNSQLAFYEMQNRGVQCGHLAGEAISEFAQQASSGENPFITQDTKFHFIAHSFGSLIIANAVRYLSLSADKTRFQPKIQTLCFLQGALSSNWFDGEFKVLDRVKGNIANVYSRYDTAVGFYYPLASFARTGMGNMGLLPVRDTSGDPKSVVQPLSVPDKPLVLLVQPPDLKSKPPKGGPIPKPGWATMLNLDASRLIFEGPIATGGGHNDIFKDDVVHLIWSACGLPMTPSPGNVPPPNPAPAPPRPDQSSSSSL